MVLPVILSGGAGSRLWPMSRELYPKQLLPFMGPQSLLQQTLHRAKRLPNTQSPLIICNEHHRFLIAEQLREENIQDATIILEPVGRNTAPAITLAALHAMSQGDDPILLVLPADHLLSNLEDFQQAVELAYSYAITGKLITFGITPTKAETAYGYIQSGVSLPCKKAFQVSGFVEKPDAVTAKSYFESGSYFWNSGMFMFQASKFISEIQKHVPEIFQACQNALNKTNSDLDFIRIDQQSFIASPSDSIDYAIMEKTNNAIVVPLQTSWSDVGSWSALWEVGQQDAAGNVLQGDVLIEDVKNSYLHADKRMLAVVGMSDCIVMETADAVLVAHKEKSQEVKKIVQQLKEKGREEAEMHRKVFRPWGAYESIDESERFKVKRITVNPGASLSLQVHHHRSEHWVVVKGTAEVTRGDEVFMLAENQSTYIPLGMQHRLSNPGKIPLELIEVQSGSYLGEDDIIRFDDVYGRTT